MMPHHAMKTQLYVYTYVLLVRNVQNEVTLDTFYMKFSFCSRYIVVGITVREFEELVNTKKGNKTQHIMGILKV